MSPAISEAAQDSSYSGNRVDQHRDTEGASATLAWPRLSIHSGSSGRRDFPPRHALGARARCRARCDRRRRHRLVV